MMIHLRKIMSSQAPKRVRIVYDRLGCQIPRTAGSAPYVLRKKGFSLAELLVVVTITSRLMAVLIPALNQVKRYSLKQRVTRN